MLLIHFAAKILSLRFFCEADRKTFSFRFIFMAT